MHLLSLFFFKKFLLLFNYSCMPFLPIPPPHPSWTHLHATYVGFLYVIAFWLLLGHSFLGPPLQLVDWGSPCPPYLLFYSLGDARAKPQNPGEKLTPTKIKFPHNPTITSKWANINKGVKTLRLLLESSGIPASTLSVLSPRLPCPVSPEVSPAHSALTFAKAQDKWLQMKICVLAL